MIEDAVEASAAQSASPEEIRVMVEEAVERSGDSSSGVTPQELETVVSSAVTEALAQQQVMAPAMPRCGHGNRPCGG